MICRRQIFPSCSLTHTICKLSVRQKFQYSFTFNVRHLYSVLRWDKLVTLHFVLGHFAPVTLSPGHFVPWSLCPRSFCPWSLCPLVILSPGHFVPWDFVPILKAMYYRTPMTSIEINDTWHDTCDKCHICDTCNTFRWNRSYLSQKAWT